MRQIDGRREEARRCWLADNADDIALAVEIALRQHCGRQIGWDGAAINEQRVAVLHQERRQHMIDGIALIALIARGEEENLVPIVEQPAHHDAAIIGLVDMRRIKHRQHIAQRHRRRGQAGMDLRQQIELPRQTHKPLPHTQRNQDRQ
jgi:hypothetical protein